MPSLVSDETSRILQRIIIDYVAGRLTGGGEGSGNNTRPPRPIRLAKVSGADIDSDAEGDAQFYSHDWSLPIGNFKVRNEFSVTVPDGTKLYVAEIQGKWRIVVPFMDCP